MAHEPFLTCRVRSCRDLVHVRHQARQIAQLLSFAPLETIRLAAAAFGIAQQAMQRLRRADVCFAQAEGRLHIFARPTQRSTAPTGELPALNVILPDSERRLAAQDLGFVIRQAQLLAPNTLEDELAKQNQEVLFLLSLVTESPAKAAQGANPSAA